MYKSAHFFNLVFLYFNQRKSSKKIRNRVKSLQPWVTIPTNACVTIILEFTLHSHTKTTTFKVASNYLKKKIIILLELPLIILSQKFITISTRHTDLNCYFNKMTTMCFAFVFLWNLFLTYIFWHECGVYYLLIVVVSLVIVASVTESVWTGTRFSLHRISVASSNLHHHYLYTTRKYWKSTPLTPTFVNISLVNIEIYTSITYRPVAS